LCYFDIKINLDILLHPTYYNRLQNKLGVHEKANYSHDKHSYNFATDFQ